MRSTSLCSNPPTLLKKRLDSIWWGGWAWTLGIRLSLHQLLTSTGSFLEITASSKMDERVQENVAKDNLFSHI